MRKILIGDIYGRLTLIDKLPGRYYLLRCICGNETRVRTDHFRRGIITSCGCDFSEKRSRGSIKHGHSGNPLYFVWASMMDRCYNENFQDYKNYGGRGIKVCGRWHDVSNFIDDVTIGYEKGLQLDRLNNDGDYDKNNCRWATRKENNRNKRTNVFITIDGQIKTMAEWSEITGVGYTSISGRVRRGLVGVDAVFGKKSIEKT